MTGTASHGDLYLVSGERGAGKTTFCGALVETALSMHPGLLAAGVLSPKVMEAGEQTAIDVVDITTARRRRLASRRGGAGLPGGPATIRWQFSAGALAWGDAVLRSATPCDLLVVDELGPLEFERKEGWPSGLAAVDSAAFKVAFVVVRPDLLGTARARWPRARLIRIENAEGAVAAARRSADELRALLGS